MSDKFFKGLKTKKHSYIYACSCVRLMECVWIGLKSDRVRLGTFSAPDVFVASADWSCNVHLRDLGVDIGCQSFRDFT